MGAPDLAVLVLPCLTAALPFLIQSGKDVGESIRKSLVEKIGKGAADVACKLWARVSGSATAKKAAERAAAEPDDEDSRTALKVEIRDLLKADPALAAELKQLLEAAGPTVGGNVATASGAGAVAVGGNVGGNVTTNVPPRGDKA